MVKKFAQFCKEDIEIKITISDTDAKKKTDKKHEFGCVMIDLDIPTWKDIINSIDSDDLYVKEGEEYGLESIPHITGLFGLLPEVKDKDIEKVINEFKDKDFDIETDGIGKFSSDEFDVLKFNIKNNKILNEFNKALSKFPYKSDFDTYIPHCTIAYLKPGKSKKYIDKNNNLKDIKIKQFVYSKTDGECLKFNI